MERYSETHDAWYPDMASEMLRHAGFQDTVNDKLRLITARDGCYPHECRWMDDLYQIYAEQDVIE